MSRILMILVAVTVWPLLACSEQADETDSRALPGTWVSATEVVDVPAGELRIQIRDDGTGDILFDRARFWWFCDRFTWTFDGEEFTLKPVLPDERLRELRPKQLREYEDFKPIVFRVEFLSDDHLRADSVEDAFARHEEAESPDSEQETGNPRSTIEFKRESR